MVCYLSLRTPLADFWPGAAIANSARARVLSPRAERMAKEESANWQCFLEWTPWADDGQWGMSHQLSSLSCALGEAYYLRRTLLLPRGGMCAYRNSGSGTISARWGSGEDYCMPWSQLIDLPLLSALVGVREERLDNHTPTVVVSGSISSPEVQKRFPCTASTRLVRRELPLTQTFRFWFGMCQTHRTNSMALTQRLSKLAIKRSAILPSVLGLLKSGLWFSQDIKAAALKIVTRIHVRSGAFAAVHVRRGDRLKRAGGCNDNCDSLTQPAALQRALSLWFPTETALFILSDERPAFFSPMRLELGGAFRLHFADDHREVLQRHGIANGYQLFAVEMLVRLGAHASVETYGYYRADSCWPVLANPSPRQRESGFVVDECKSGRVHNASDASARVNGVYFGGACSAWRSVPCRKHMHFEPEPKQCKAEQRANLSQLESVAGDRCAWIHGASVT